jgi:hypothetical protein
MFQSLLVLGHGLGMKGPHVHQVRACFDVAMHKDSSIVGFETPSFAIDDIPGFAWCSTQATTAVTGVLLQARTNGLVTVPA